MAKFIDKDDWVLKNYSWTSYDHRLLLEQGHSKTIDIQRNVDCSSIVMCPIIALPLPRAFLWQPLTVMTRTTRQAVHAIDQSIFLGCLCLKQIDVI